jgi:hypothetical protein
MSYDRDRFIKNLALAHATLGRIRDSILDVEDYLYAIESSHNRMIGEDQEATSWLGNLFSDMYAEEDSMSPYCDCEYCRAERITAPDYRMD